MFLKSSHHWVISIREVDEIEIPRPDFINPRRADVGPRCAGDSVFRGGGIPRKEGLELGENPWWNTPPHRSLNQVPEPIGERVKMNGKAKNPIVRYAIFTPFSPTFTALFYK
jgi:hypothetical protein